LAQGDAEFRGGRKSSATVSAIIILCRSEAARQVRSGPSGEPIS